MKFQQWPKRDPNKNYFMVPNEVFHIGLSHPKISIYCYLLSIEDRETYQCWPSYKTIGKALGMCERSHPYQADHDTKQGRQAAQRKPALHNLPHPGGGGIVLPAAVPAAGGGCCPSEGGGASGGIRPQKPPERPVCAFRSGSESQCRSGVGGPIWPAFGGASGGERKSRINDGA